MAENHARFSPVDEVACMAYFSACRERVPDFVDRHFSWRGALRLHRSALGRDLLVAPLNVLLALPALLIRLLIGTATRLRLHAVARTLARVPLGVQTSVERSVISALGECVFGCTAGRATCDEVVAAVGLADASERGQFARVFERSVSSYAAARTAIAEITVALVAGLLGLVLLDRFSPGSLSAGRALADAVGHELAIREFWLGDTLGGWYFGIFEPDTPTWLIIGVVLLVMMTLSVCAAFAGVVADPLQRVLGLHQRRVNRLLRTVERAALAHSASSFDPKDHYVARAADVFDLLRGLWPG